MNWQTQHIKVWLDHYSVPIAGLSSSELELKVTDYLLVRDYPSATARLKNAAMRELLAEVNWKDLAQQ